MLRLARVESAIKALLLIAMGLFLYSRFANGTLFFYINQRFQLFTLFAVAGLLIVGLSYRFATKAENLAVEHHHDDDHHHHHHHEHPHDHAHSHGLSWGGIALVLLPIILGVVVPPQPLGAAALSNRELNAGFNETTSLPGVLGADRTKAARDKNVLDWWDEFRTSSAPNEDPALLGQEARVIGFVYKDQRLGDGHFMLVRYIVSCCVADASAIGLVVAAPDLAALQDDQWVEVSGTLVAGNVPNWQMPVIQAQTIQPVDVPAQPYLYP